jgi:hypothetical protein
VIEAEAERHKYVLFPEPARATLIARLLAEID